MEPWRGGIIVFHLEKKGKNLKTSVTGKVMGSQNTKRKDPGGGPGPALEQLTLRGSPSLDGTRSVCIRTALQAFDPRDRFPHHVSEDRGHSNGKHPSSF